MKSKAAIAIANTQGRLMFYYNNSRYEKIVDELFANRDDIELTLQDENIKARGNDQILKAFQILDKKCDVSSCQKDIHMINSPIIKVSERELSAQANWCALGFNLKIENNTCVAEPIVTRFDADYVFEDGNWKILTLQWYAFLSLNPWVCPLEGVSESINNRFKDFFSVPESQNCTTEKDWWEILTLQNRFAHCRRKDFYKYFSNTNDAKLYLPMYMDSPAIGYSNIKAVLEHMDELEELNEKLYLSVLMDTNPVIEVDKTGNYAKGSWIGLNVGIFGPAFGNDIPPYPVKVQFIHFKQTFAKENGIWKIHDYVTDIIFSAPVWYFDPQNTAGLIGHNRAWHYPPEYVGKGIPDDFLEIENIQGMWVGALKSARTGEVVDRLVAYDDKDVEYHTNDPFMEASTYSMERVANNVVGAKGIDNYRIKARELERIKNAQPHHPSCHSTTTPVIVVHGDGKHATAFWFDFGWTMFAEGFGLPRSEWKANPCFARYAQEYVKDSSGKWKILKLNYYPLFRLNTMWPFSDNNVRGWAGSNTAELWPLPFERYINEDLC